ncbi:hypothetical protein ACFL5V_13190 [Fibrobacterota bacterium]
MVRSFLLFAAVLSLFQTGFAGDDETLSLEICNDSLYLHLKGKNINELQEREYEYFKQYDADCNRMKQLHFQKKEAATGKAIKAVSSILGIVATIVGIVFVIYLIKGQEGT